MKTWKDRLMETGVEVLKERIKYQKASIKIAQRDLKTMERVLNIKLKQKTEGEAEND